jgi:hypothetical protein
MSRKKHRYITIMAVFGALAEFCFSLAKIAAQGIPLNLLINNFIKEYDG